MEEIRKLDDNNVLVVEPEKIIPENIVTSKTFENLEADLKQAQDSLVYIQQKHAEEIAPIQKTIDIMQSRVVEAIRLGIKRVEVVAQTEEIQPIEG